MKFRPCLWRFRREDDLRARSNSSKIHPWKLDKRARRRYFSSQPPPSFCLFSDSDLISFSRDTLIRKRITYLYTRGVIHVSIIWWPVRDWPIYLSLISSMAMTYSIIHTKNDVIRSPFDYCTKWMYTIYKLIWYNS